MNIQWIENNTLVLYRRRNNSRLVSTCKGVKRWKKEEDFNSLHFMSERRIIINAVLGGEVAVPYHLQSAIARLNSLLRYGDLMVCLKELVLTYRSRATGTREPCQVRKEAAVSGHSCVPWRNLDRAMHLSNA